MTDTQLTRTREDFAFILRFCSAALLVRDRPILDEFTVWLRDLLGPRGVSGAVIRSSFEAIIKSLGRAFPLTIDLLQGAATVL